MSRHSKHWLNTDVLNGKHYYEMGKHQYEGLIRSIMPLHVQCYFMLTPVVKYNCIMFLRKYKTTHKYTVTTKIFLYFFQKCSSLFDWCLEMFTHMMVCVCQNTILRRHNTVLKAKLHFAGDIKGFAFCVSGFGFWDLCLEFWENEACFMCVSNREKL